MNAINSWRRKKTNHFRFWFCGNILAALFFWYSTESTDAGLTTIFQNDFTKYISPFDSFLFTSNYAPKIEAAFELDYGYGGEMEESSKLLSIAINWY